MRNNAELQKDIQDAIDWEPLLNAAEIEIAIEVLNAFKWNWHGVLGITKNIAVQYATQNIRGNALCPYYVETLSPGSKSRFAKYNALCPYYVETPLLNVVPDEVHKAWVEGTPAKRLCKPEEVAKAFIYLACDDSSDCNGTQTILDGGVMA